jgi:DNA primase
MIIIPSYNDQGNINYFTARNFNKNSKIKFRNPDTSKDIIGFELFINWNVPIILCEGMFDAIAIKRNVIPLLGKTIQPNLMKKIINSSVQKIYIALDRDAIKQALEFCETLINEGTEVYLLDLSEKDPSDLGFERFTNLIQNTYPLTFSNLLEKKMNLI